MIGLKAACASQARAVLIRFLRVSSRRKDFFTCKVNHTCAGMMSGNVKLAADDTSTLHEESRSHEKDQDDLASQNTRSRKTSELSLLSLSDVSLQIKENSTPYAATVIHPGFPPELRDNYNHPSLWGLLKLASLSRIYAMHTPVDSSGCSFLEYNKLTDKRFTFFAASQASIAQCLYEPGFPTYPLEVHMTGGHIGRTSISTVATITCPRDPQQQMLFTQINQVVLVDKVTRRPVPVDDFWRERYGPHCVRSVPLIIKQKEAPQTGAAATCQVKVAWSDTDDYKHTNFSSYLRFAIDAVHDALRQGALGDRLTQKHVRAGVADMSVSYLGESVQGDVLQVHMWCPQDAVRTVVCSMEKDGKVINQVSLTYHEAKV